MRVTVECFLPENTVVEGWTEKRDDSLTKIEGYKPVCLSAELEDNDSAPTELTSLYKNVIQSGAIADHTCGISLYNSEGKLEGRFPNYLLKKRGA